MRNPNPLMLLRIAQADAYCMAVEYVGRDAHAGLISDARRFERFLRHPSYHKLGAGQYTDDTQMSVACAEQLLSGEKPTVASFAHHFMQAFLRDKRDGYSRGFQAILEQCNTGQELQDRLDPSSTKNGAAMRSVPLGVIRDIEEMLLVATTQARVTHDTEEGTVSSCAVAFLSHWALYSDRGFDEACDDMARIWPQFAKAFTMGWTGPVADRSFIFSEMTEGTAWDVGINTVSAVCSLLRGQTTLMGILDQVIEWGGDTDSAAAVAWGIASTRMQEDVPEFLERDLEPGGQYGPSFLRGLGARLMDAYA